MRSGLVAFAILLGACGAGNPGADTCSGGENMQQPRLLAGLEDAGAGGYRVRIGWDPGTGPGAGLRRAYFEAVDVDDATSTGLKAVIASVSLTNEREISVVLSEHPQQAAAAEAVVLVLGFPDRRGFIECSHPGMTDRYLLRLTLRFDASGALIGSEFEQTARLGPI